MKKSKVFEEEFQIEEELDNDYFKGKKAQEIARELLGFYIENIENNCGGLIIETEAYIGEKDKACHLKYGRTDRNQPFFKGAGTIYVFKIHQHHNINIISEYNKQPECILIRALEPIKGLDKMKKNRNKDKLNELASGPGKLTEALEINQQKHNNKELNKSCLNIYSTSIETKTQSTGRIGISQATEYPLRFIPAKQTSYNSKNKKRLDKRHLEVEEIYREIEKGEFKHKVD